MRIGFAGPIDLRVLLNNLNDESKKKLYNFDSQNRSSQLAELVQEYIKLGYEVSVYTLIKTNLPNKFLKLKGENLNIFIGPFNRGRKMIFDFMAKERFYLKKFILEDMPNVIHAHWTYEYAQATIASKLPHIITVRDWAPYIFRINFKLYRLMRLIMNHFTLKKTKNITSNSPYIAEKLKKYYDLDSEVIPNGAKNSFFNLNEKNFNKSSPKIISIGNSSKCKNIKCLIKAFTIYNKDRINKAYLHLVGDGLERDGIMHRWALTNNLDNEYIIYLGLLKKDQLVRELSKIDLLVHPSLEESFGNVLIEAMANKIPVIAGKNSGATSFVLNYGKAGKLVDVTNAEEICKSIDEILNNEKNWNYYSNAGFEYVKKSFKLSEVAKMYIYLLEKNANY